MATIRGIIQIQDQMSPALRAMNNAMNICISSFQSMQDVSSNAVDVSNLQAAQRELQNAEMAINQVEENINAARNSQENFNNTVQNAHGPMDSLIGKAKSLVGAYLGMQAVKGIIGASDEMAQTQARLQLMTGDLQKTKELQNMIFQSAQRSRASYADTANAVAQLGNRAKNAFNSNEEVIAFSEQLNKMFTIVGASQEEMSSATLQLTQALGSGVLRGEEFNAVFEAAPNVMQAVADYIGKPIGELKDLASEGEITADIVKKAMFAAADETNAKFESMPKTIGQIWQGIKNEALMAFQPILLKINEVANNPGFNTLINNVSGACSTIAIILLNIINLVCSVAQFFSDNWGIIEPIIWGIIAALGAYLVIMGLVNLANLASAISTGAASLAADIYAASLDMQAGATFVATASQYGLNAALLACPLVWIVILIVAVITALVAWSVHTNGLKATWLMFTNVLMTAWDSLKLSAVFLAFTVMNAWDSMLEGCKTAAVGIQNALGNMKANGLMIIQNFVNGAIDLINDLINTVNEIPGVSLETIQHVTFGTEAMAENQAEQTARNNDLVAYKVQKEANKQARQDAFNNMFNEAKANYQDRIKGIEAAKAAHANGQDTSILDMFKDNTDYQSLLDAAEGASQGAGDTAKNTGAMKDALDITEEDLKYMRDIAEQEVINRFTTAEIKVDMTNYNSVNSDLDIDGIVDTLAIKVEEQMNISAEGVHE